MTEDNHPGYVTRDGMWAAVPCGKSQFVIIHNGRQVHVSRSIETAKNYINREARKLKK